MWNKVFYVNANIWVNLWCTVWNICILTSSLNRWTYLKHALWNFSVDLTNWYNGVILLQYLRFIQSGSTSWFSLEYQVQSKCDVALTIIFMVIKSIEFYISANSATLLTCLFNVAIFAKRWLQHQINIEFIYHIHVFVERTPWSIGKTGYGLILHGKHRRCNGIL